MFKDKENWRVNLHYRCKMLLLPSTSFSRHVQQWLAHGMTRSISMIQ